MLFSYIQQATIFSQCFILLMIESQLNNEVHWVLQLSKRAIKEDTESRKEMSFAW